MGSRGTGNNINTSTITEQQLLIEANRLGVDGNEIIGMLEDYEASSYGGNWSTLSKFIEQANNLHYDRGDIYRGITLDSKQAYENLLNKFERTKTIDDRKDWMSWTSDQKIAEQYSKQFEDDFDNSIIFVNKTPVKTAIATQDILDIRDQVGINIDGKWHPESQVLYSANKSFKITNIKRGKNVSYVYVVEK